MSRSTALAAAVFAIGALTACGHRPSSEIATVDIARITANWPKFINYDRQLQADMRAIDTQNAPDAVKEKARAQLQQRYVAMQTEVTDDVRDATAQVAKARNFKMVLTREYVGYGGVDITPDVEKILNITEVTPTR